MNTDKNIAFIDAQNLHLGTKENGWGVDHKKFRTYLRDQLSVDEAYYYFGYIDERYQDLYTALQKKGFIVRFKSSNNLMLSQKKGNVDTDIIFDVMKMLLKNEVAGKIVLVSSDGDYAKLVNFLVKEGKFEKILFPCGKRSSSLFNTTDNKYKLSLGRLRNKIEYRHT